MDVQVFTHEDFDSVRVFECSGAPWFVGKDVANVLGYSNPRDALAKRVDTEDKGVAKCDTLGGEQEVTVINESGLYSLILSSKLPAAKKFKRWVTSEVLPTIRKHGVYAIDEMLANPEAMICALMAYREEREKRLTLMEENAVQK